MFTNVERHSNTKPLPPRFLYTIGFSELKSITASNWVDNVKILGGSSDNCCRPLNLDLEKARWQNNCGNNPSFPYPRVQLGESWDKENWFVQGRFLPTFFYWASFQNDFWKLYICLQASWLPLFGKVLKHFLFNYNLQAYYTLYCKLTCKSLGQ